MKLRSLIVAMVVLLALIGTLYWSEHRKVNAEPARSADSPSILNVDAAAVTRFEIKKKGAEPLLLSKNSAGSWQIVQPEALGADQSAVSSALSSVSTLNSERLVEDKASNLKQYGLEPPGLEVDLTEKDNKTHKLLIGDDTPTGGGVYATMAGDPRVFTIATYTKTSLDKGLNDLRDKRLVTISGDKVSRLELDRKNQTIEFGRNKDEWQILKPKPLRADSVQVNELVQKLTDARMDLSGEQEDSKKIASLFANAEPFATARVTDPSGTQELQIRKSKDSYYARSSAVNGTYKVTTDIGQAFDKGVDDFRNKKLFEFGFTDPAKIEIHNGSTALFLTRSGTDWWSNGRKMDAGSVQALISSLRDLTASKLVETGFKDPTLEITVTSEDSKRVEKILVAKNAGGSIARRENDTTLYELGSDVIEQLQKASQEIKPAIAPAK